MSPPRLIPALLLVLVACLSCVRNPDLVAQPRTPYPSLPQRGNRETPFSEEMHERFRSETGDRATQPGRRAEPIQKTVERLYR